MAGPATAKPLPAAATYRPVTATYAPCYCNVTLCHCHVAPCHCNGKPLLLRSSSGEVGLSIRTGGVGLVTCGKVCRPGYVGLVM
ncbi:hypothetical protein VN12_23975 [Pirellula sp. SH-Sr6A]|nr:hypothetical protein VN12_23975 [Pirellula sp. SH-Sr6A]